MENEIFKEALNLIKDSGWMGVSIFGIWIIQKLLTLSIWGFSIFKIINKIVDLISKNTGIFEKRVASVLGVNTPLKEQEINEVLDKIRKK